MKTTQQHRYYEHPNKLPAESDLAKLADDALLQQRLLVNNPVDLNREDIFSIYQSAYR